MHCRVEMLNQRLPVKQIQKLMIDPYYSPPADQEYYYSSSSSTSSSSSSIPPPPDMSSSIRTPSSGKPDWRICFALCLYEYNSTDPDHLSFRENEVLEIVKQEDSGWWAAFRNNRIGWVPSTFLQPITDNNAATIVRNAREDSRSTIPGRLSGANSVSHRSRFFISDSPLSQQPYTQEDRWVPVVGHEDTVSHKVTSCMNLYPHAHI